MSNADRAKAIITDILVNHLIRQRITTVQQVEIGELDAKLRLPTSARISARMETICDACGEHITDEFFIAGFKRGCANMKLHEDCAP